MKLTMLGTGSASVTKCFNTCFAFSKNDEHFLVDAGGGNQILKVLEDNNIKVTDIHHIFITHSHTDHILGAVWLVRMIGQAINYDGCPDSFNIYCHDEAADALKAICHATLPASVTKHFDGRIKLHILNDADKHNILNFDVDFFDIKSDKTKQFGFVMTTENGKRLVCCGDEPMIEDIAAKAANCDWLMHEAFCLYSERAIFKPYEKFHSTVKDACETAEKLGVKNIILYHTEDTHLKNRKELYTAEGKQYYKGNIYVPDDNEIFEI
ncbi:MAG: MBL fold metallo-hydrolase [Oscillospiraceae bacterium]|nr:MBL fold metallo-hydrolase [Oscillospiraceae bacterium]